LNVPTAPNTIAIARALRLIRAHDAVVSVVVEKETAGGVLATVEIKTELPSEWRAAGKSPSGVRKIEPVTFRFGPRYPIQPPDIRLRADFDHSHPHLQPGSADELPEPCLFAGSPRELLRLRGILGLVEQLADWLDKAATLDLIDPKQGWEPVRRDHIEDVIVSDGAWLKSLARTDAGCSAFNVIWRCRTTARTRTGSRCGEAGRPSVRWSTSSSAGLSVATRTSAEDRRSSARHPSNVAQVLLAGQVVCNLSGFAAALEATPRSSHVT
jgi:hypothetical protein